MFMISLTASTSIIILFLMLPPLKATLSLLNQTFTVIKSDDVIVKCFYCVSPDYYILGERLVTNNTIAALLAIDLFTI